MNIDRRDFNRIFLSTSALTLIPFNVSAAAYKRPILWAGTSFLAKEPRINIIMPLIKGAFDMHSDFFNSSLLKELRKRKPIKNLNLDGLSGEKGKMIDASLALTLSFASEFDFGGFDDPEKGKFTYYIRTFAHCVLYNPKERLLVSSVPVRARMGGALDIKEKENNWQSNVLKESFYNIKKPEETILEQFLKMSSKLSLTNQWRGKAPRVTSVTFSKKNKTKFKDKSFKLEFEDFIEFLGQSSTAAFSYKLNQPIIPYSVTESVAATISVFNDTRKMFTEIEAALPKTEISIKIHHKGWKFKEKPLTPPMQQVTLYIGLKIQIIDIGFDEVLYSQHFSASKRYVEDMKGTLRSDAGEVCVLTEGLLERAFTSIDDEQYRKKLSIGELNQLNKSVSTMFKLAINKKDPDYFKKTENQSKKVMDTIKDLPKN